MVNGFKFFGLSSTPISKTKFSIWIGFRGYQQTVGHSFSHHKVIIEVTSSSPRFNFSKKFDPRNHLEYGNFGYIRQAVETNSYGNTFKIKVTLGGEVKGEGKFKTFPKNPEKFAFAFISCTDPDKESDHNQLKRQNQGFKRMVEQMSSEHPLSFCLHLGDNFYSHRSRDENIYEAHMWNKVYKMRNKGWIKKAYGSIPFIHTWDNHDHVGSAPFGLDHKGKSRKRRNRFSKIFKVPSKSQNPDGIYHSFETNGCGFFIMDSRSQRAKDRSQVWGKKQWDWLENSIKNSNNFINFICTSSPLVKHSPPKNEGHVRRIGYYEGDYNRLHRLIHKYKNIVILTGDVHRCKYRLHSFDAIHSKPIVHEGHASIEKTKYLALYSSGIGRFKKRNDSSPDNWYEQSYLTVIVEPEKRILTVRRVPRSSFKLTRGYPYEKKYPMQTLINPEKDSISYISHIT